MKNKKYYISSPGLELLTISFIVLKLLGKIDWPWLWVVSPIWIPFAIIIVIFLIAVLCKVIINIYRSI